MRIEAALRISLLCGIAAFALPGFGEEEGDPARSPGVWSKWGDPVLTVPGIPLACRQKWVCSPPTDILSAEGVQATPAEWVDGACAAGGGAVDECNLCMTNEPTTACEWWSEG